MTHRNRTEKPAILTLLLAILHGAAGLSILVISSWFIAISAIAPLGFNYVIPAVVIRALALLRIASGYASMWVGHNDLLYRISGVRLLVFSQLTNAHSGSHAYSTEALAHHTEEVASMWIAWIAPLSSVLILFVSVCVGASTFGLPGAPILWVGFVGWLFIMSWQGVRSLKGAGHYAASTTHFREQTTAFFDTSAIWHLKKTDSITLGQSPRYQLKNVPSAKQVWRDNLTQQASAHSAAWLFQGVAYCLLIGGLLATSSVFYTPLAIVVPMVLLASPDWASSAFHAVTRFSQWLHSRNALNALSTVPYDNLNNVGLNQQLQCEHLKPLERRSASISAVVQRQGITLLQGASGSGKSSLLQAMVGLIPSTGRRIVDGVPLPQGLIEGWRYVEQSPTVLSATIKQNLDPAGLGVTEQKMDECLRALGLDSLLPLETWVGKAGRHLSGGESKRLVLARAILSSPSLLCVDEPFEGLDAESQQRVCTLLKRVSATTPIVVASHVVPAALCRVDCISLDPVPQAVRQQCTKVQALSRGQVEKR